MENPVEQEIIRLYNDGMSLRDIVSTLHIDHYTVWQHLVKNKLDGKNDHASRPKTRISDAAKQKAIELRKQGAPWWKIKDITGISKGGQTRMWGAHRIKSRITEEEKQTIVDMRTNGATYMQIVKATGRSYDSVFRVLKDAGIAFHRGEAVVYNSIDDDLEDVKQEPLYEMKQPEQPAKQPETTISDKERAVLEARHALELAETRLEVAKLEAQLADARARLESL